MAAFRFELRQASENVWMTEYLDQLVGTPFTGLINPIYFHWLEYKNKKFKSQNCSDN